MQRKCPLHRVDVKSSPGWCWEKGGQGERGQGRGTSVFTQPASNRDVPKALPVNLSHLLPTGQTVTPNQFARNLGYVLPKLTSG